MIERRELPQGTDPLDVWRALGGDPGRVALDSLALDWPRDAASAGALAANHCSECATTMVSATGRVGSTASTSAAWSDNADLGCMQAARLYCFQQ